MIQVKEFKTMDNGLDNQINMWIKENVRDIIIKDIKYQFTFNELNHKWSSALVIYEIFK